MKKAWGPFFLMLMLAGPADGLHAADPFQKCLQAPEKPIDRPSAACFFNTARRLELWEEGAERLARRLRGDGDNPWVHFNLGRVLQEWSQRGAPKPSDKIESAVAHFQRAARRFEIDGEQVYAGYSWFNCSRLLRRQGRLLDARQALRTAAQVDKSAALRLSQLVRIDQAVLMQTLGEDLETARRLLSSVLDELALDSDIRGTLLLELGNVNFLMGAFGRADERFRESLESALQGRNPYREALARFSLANNAIAQRFQAGEGLSELQPMVEEALQRALASQNRLVEAKSRHVLGKLLKGPESEAHLRQCLSLAQQISLGLVAQCRLALAARLADKDPETARRLLEDSADNVLRLSNPWDRLYGVLERYRAAWTLMPRDEALADSLAILDRVETLRGWQRLGAGRARVFSVWTGPYYWVSGRLLQDAEGSDHLHQAFRITERMRARLLLDVLIESGIGPRFDRDSALLENMVEASAQKAELEQRLLDPRTSASERSAVRSESERIESRLEEISGRLTLSDPVWAERHRSRLASLELVAENLQPEEALLSFQLADRRNPYGDFGGGAWLIAATRADARAYPLPDRQALERRTRLFNGLVQRRDDSHQRASERMFDDLLRAALEDLPPQVDHLILVPDGALHQLPFPMLSDAGRPLVSRYRLSTVPSATLWLTWRQRRGLASSQQTLFLADPEPPKSQKLKTADPQPDWTLRDGATLGRLPYAREEARSARRLLGPDLKLLEGPEASERALKTLDLRPFRMLSFAAHTVVDDLAPERSAVALSPGDPEEDGLLRPSEIAALDLTDKVVTLSSCRSASGQLLRGEGVMSVARAFFEAGAGAVAAGLWPLRDREAASLFERFYAHLAEGADLASAMADAQREALEAGRHPAAWAGLLVIGDGARAPFQTRPPALSGRWIAIAAALLATFLIVLLRRTQKAVN